MSKRTFGDRLLYGVCLGVVAAVLLLGTWAVTYEILLFVYELVVTS